MIRACIELNHRFVGTPAEVAQQVHDLVILPLLQHAGRVNMTDELAGELAKLLNGTAPVLAEDCVIVPDEPTGAMLDAAVRGFGKFNSMHGLRGQLRGAYKAAVEAAQEPT